ncbi:lipase member I-like [Aricia agestis]|uniref:lipase member I-like n=1 Tax=Aricia agestis TaxID=91739 RepID=UPI001C205C5B|nr:lipase member I-like [Aricia agestis]
MERFLFVFFAALAACNANAISARQGSFNTYHLYTSQNIRIPTAIPPTEAAIRVSDINPNLKTVIVVHGHGGSMGTSLNPLVKDALLTREDVNVIVVDWSVFASQSYSNAVTAVPSVGTFLAGFISQAVIAEKVSLATLHLVGFDLGAHVVGFAGRVLNGNVARITGLNPSDSQWGSNSQRLSISDARYVEVIHTDSGLMFSNGIHDAIGHVDFYVNGGNNQPGCFYNNGCSHNRSWEVFAASLTHDHLIGNLCGTWLQISLNTCRSFTLPMGTNDLEKIGSGMYRVNTGRTYPY